MTKPRHTASCGCLTPRALLPPGDPGRMSARIIESVDMEPAPLRLGASCHVAIHCPPIVRDSNILKVAQSRSAPHREGQHSR